MVSQPPKNIVMGRPRIEQGQHSAARELHLHELQRVQVRKVHTSPQGVRLHQGPDLLLALLLIF